jgi:hypothetical protein
MDLREIDGGPGYFSQFASSLPTDPSYFPIGVWFESVTSQADINLDRAAGLNTYVVITSNSNFNLVQANGMYLLAQQDELRNNATVQATAEGILIADEIDMTQGPSTGYASLESRISALPAAWNNHIIYNNYGKGVMFWETDAQAARFVNGTPSFGPYQHIVSADTYWFTDPNIDGASEGGRLLNNGNPLTEAQTRLAANYGYTVDRMRYLDGLDGERMPVWNFVEVGWPFTETAAQGARAIQPEEIQAAVWHSIIAGAQGIVYFNHSFGGPDQTQHALRDPRYAEERAAVTETNALIEQLAPVLNSPFDDAFVTVGPSVRVMARFYDGDHYVFAGSTQHAASTATFTLAGFDDGIATVIGENRTITITDGQFFDSFADGNAIHIYHIDTVGTQPSEIIDYDDANAQSWSYVLYGYDAQNRLDYSQVGYDDGSLLAIDYDQAEAQSWSYVHHGYDAQSSLDYSQVGYDDGSLLAIDYDQADAQLWNYVHHGYDAQSSLDYSHVGYDDGSLVAVDYDQENTADWSYIQSTFSPQAELVSTLVQPSEDEGLIFSLRW